MAARRFLARRGWAPGKYYRRASQNDAGPAQPIRTAIAPRPRTQSSPTFTWQALGPDAVTSPDFGLVTGRVSALALDPADPSGNHLYIGTTGGGVWVAQNAAVTNAADVVFTPLTDAVGALSTAFDPSISIGAVTVQPGGTGVVLAGTGDPNDSLDSYYGAGILRSADGGNTWSLTQITTDGQYSFIGEGIAGFAWSSVNPELVVAAVSQAYEGTLVNAVLPGRSFEGLYYSSDGGATWSLATITDGGNTPVQGPGYVPGTLDGNAATSVVWNPIRNLFIAAVRFHGYYQSSDGITFTRMTAQPGSGLTTSLCPTNFGNIGSLACPIFRGTLAVNPLTGDTFAWTVDFSNQDQGLWQDQCALSSGVCGSQNVAFAKQWNTQALETNTDLGAATIANGDYNLTLAAVPFSLQQGADTWLLAGANDLWKCSLAQGCVWRNTTNATTCMSAQVGEFQHALTWSAANPLEILIGNDSGLWRSLDAIGETGPVCSGSDATHFQNLNGGLGSLAEVESLATSPAAQYNMMAGLGVNGTAGLKSAAAPAADWPQILGGYGGPVAIDPRNTANWYVNNQSGVSIYICSDPSTCNSTGFGSTPVITDADVGGDGYSPPTDHLIPTSLVFPPTAVGGQPAAAMPVLLTNLGDTPLTCIVAWTGVVTGNPSNCLPEASSGEFTVSSNTCNGQLAGHQGCNIGVIFSPTALGTRTGTLTVYDALRTQTVALSGIGVANAFLTVSSMSLKFPTGSLGVASAPMALTINNTGGVAAANVAFGITGSEAASFATGATTCGASLASGASCTVQVIFTPGTAGGNGATLTVASATTGVNKPTVLLNGVGQVTAGLNVNPAQLTFAATIVGTSSAAQTVTVSNTSAVAASALVFSTSAGFVLAQNACTATLAANASCTVGVVFTPASAGVATGALDVSSSTIVNSAAVELGGTGAAAVGIQLTPATLKFATTGVGQDSSPATVMVTNSGTVSTLANLVITAPAGFELVNNTCPGSLGPGVSCNVGVEFAPTAAGTQTGNLTVTSSSLGTGASVPLSGMGFDFTVTLSGAGTETVSAGQTAGYTLVLTPLAGSAGVFAFACDSLPTNALCLFNPATETLTTGATGNVAVGISTGSTTASLRPKDTGLLAAIPLACGLIVLPLGWKWRHKMLCIWVLIAVLGGLMSGMASCTSSGGGGGGGSGGGNGGGGQTPAGTYSVPLTVTSTGVSHSVTVTLVVD